MNNVMLIPTLTALTGYSHVRLRDSGRRFRAGGPYIDVLGRVVIAVVRVATGGASPFPDGQRQAINDAAAGATGLATREESTNGQDRHLVLQLPAEFPEPGITDALCQVPVALHPIHVQVLNSDRSKSFAQISRQHVQEPVTAVPDASMCPCYGELGFGVVAAPIDLPRRTALANRKPAFGGTVELGVSYFLSGGEGCERRNPEVNTDNSLALAGAGDFGFDGYCDVPATGCAADSNVSYNLAFMEQRTRHSDAVALGEFEAASIDPDSGRLGLIPVSFALAFERRVGSPFGEEVAEGCPEIGCGAVDYLGVHLGKPFRARLAEQLCNAVGACFPPSLVFKAPLFEAPIPDEARGSHVLQQKAFLFGSRVDTNLAGTMH